MSAILIFDPIAWFAHEHPALVHLPIAAALLVPVALLLSLWRREEGWRRTAQFIAWAGLIGSGAALLSGLLWARQMGFIAPGGWLAKAQDGHLQGLLRTHQLLASAGLACALFTLAGLHRVKALLPALLLSFAWAAAWGAAGHWGGRMVFPEAARETEAPVAVQAAAAPPPDFHGMYLDMCASCHGEDGSARTASGQKLSGRDFTNRKWQASRTDAQIAKVVLDGKGSMPPFRGTLSETDALALTQQVLRPMGTSH